MNWFHRIFDNWELSFLHCFRVIVLMQIFILFLELVIGECSNQAVYLICHQLCHLKKLAFVGSDLTYSGVIGLITRKSTLEELQIQNPRFLTRHSLKTLARYLTSLTSLRYYNYIDINTLATIYRISDYRLIFFRFLKAYNKKKTKHFRSD